MRNQDWERVAQFTVREWWYFERPGKVLDHPARAALNASGIHLAAVGDGEVRVKRTQVLSRAKLLEHAHTSMHPNGFRVEHAPVAGIPMT
jgi:hypothetical protein